MNILLWLYVNRFHFKLLARYSNISQVICPFSLFLLLEDKEHTLILKIYNFLYTFSTFFYYSLFNVQKCLSTVLFLSDAGDAYSKSNAKMPNSECSAKLFIHSPTLKLIHWGERLQFLKHFPSCFYKKKRRKSKLER